MAEVARAVEARVEIAGVAAARAAEAAAWAARAVEERVEASRSVAARAVEAPPAMTAAARARR